ncbi:MAG: hypothetical protein LBQ05_00025 [Christensenellaceae bacterium]|jgi:hypothetical protein|nr:hypothetical protein [Christensenellaceae bacterium]
MTKNELFIELAKPDDNGKSRWVSVNEFVGKYSSLAVGNGADWARRDGQLAKKYIIEFDKSITSGNRVDRVRLNGFNTIKSFNQQIRNDIKEYYKNKNCVMLGVNGNSANVQIEIDHKDGRKNNETVSNKETQKLEDFQPLCKAANDIKRQICKECKATNKRWNAKNITGNPYPYYCGAEEWTDELGCKGCYQYDPVEYRKESVRKIVNEVSHDIMSKLYGGD